MNGKLLPRLRELSHGPLPIEMWSLGSSALGEGLWPEAATCGVGLRTFYGHPVHPARLAQKSCLQGVSLVLSTIMLATLNSRLELHSQMNMTVEYVVVLNF